MNKLFGASKKKEEPKPEEVKPEDKVSMSDMSNKLEERGNTV